MTNVAFLKVTAFNFIQIYYDNYYEKMNESPVMPTIRDVAELACVSVATVSRVINHSPSVSEKTRYSVQRAMEVLNYQPMQTHKLWQYKILIPLAWWLLM